MRAIVLKSFAVMALILATTAGAQTWDCGETPGTVTATLNGGTLTISGSGEMAGYCCNCGQDGFGKVPPWSSSGSSITRVVIDNGVTSISICAFSNCSDLTSVTIPNSVIYVGEWAFSNCSGLTSVTILDGVTSIGNEAFAYCTGLTSVTIPNSVTSIGYGAFAGCNGLTSVAISNSVTSIGDRVFSGCTGLTSVTIPDSVTSIGGHAFGGCTGLTSVIIGDGVTSIHASAFFGSIGLTSVTIGKGLTSVIDGFYGFRGYPDLTEINVDDGNTAYSSVDGVLFNKTKTTLVSYPRGNQRATYSIPNSVTEIESSAFYRCTRPTSVTIPNSMTSIGYGAFRDYTGLTSVTIPNSVTSIEERAFESSGLTSVTIPNSVTSIGDDAFSGCTDLTSVMIGGGVTSIGKYAFSFCDSLTSVTIPNSVTEIGSGAFGNCSGLKSVTIGNGLTSTNGFSFSVYPNLTSIEVGGGNSRYSSIDGVLFNKTQDTLLTYPRGKQGAYIIPNSVISIGILAFYYCSSLTSVTSYGEVPPTVDGDAFRGVSLSSVKLYVPADAINAYRTAEVWKDFETVEAAVSVLTPNRVVPQTKPTEEATVIAPVTVLAGEFTAGPNPVSRQSGIVNFYRQGRRIANCELRIYDAAGNVINKVKIRDNAIGNQARRKVGSWDLCDRNGRIVSEGTYLVKGVIKTSDGKSEKVSLIVGVR